MRFPYTFLTVFLTPLLVHFIIKLRDQPELLDLVTRRLCSSVVLETLSLHSPGWGTWFHPERQTGRVKPEQRAGWNLLYHLGGHGPWIRRSAQNASEIVPPKGCTVDQVHMVCVLRCRTMKNIDRYISGYIDIAYNMTTIHLEIR